MPHTAVHLLYAAEGHSPRGGSAVCTVCGESCPAGSVDLPPAFMDIARFEGRGSSMCDACRHYFGAGRRYILLGSVLVTASALRRVERVDLDAVLFSEPWPVEPYALCISAAKQKQVIPWARVNAPHADPAISTDQWGEVSWTRAELAAAREAYRWLYLDAGFSRDAILADRYDYLGQWAKKGGDVEQWQRRRAVLHPWLGGAELEVLAFSTPRASRGD